MKRPLRIVYLNDYSLIGGAEQSLTLLAKSLDRHLFEATVVCPAKGPLINVLKERDIRVIPADIYHFSRKHSPFKYLASLKRLGHILRSLDVDIIHSNSSTAAQWAIPLGRLMSKRTICHIRGLRDVCARFTSFIVRHAPDKTHFIAISKLVGKTLKSIGVSDSQIKVIYNGVDIKEYHPNIDTSNFEQEYPRDTKKLRIGIIGRIAERKRHIDVIEAAGLLSSRVNLQAFMVGEMWQNNEHYHSNLRSRIVELGLSDSIIFTGFRSNIPEIMASMDIIVVPSLNEPFGRVTIEAMALAKPVIGTLSGATPEIIEDGINGILVPVKSPEAIANAIERIANNRNYAKKLGENARRRAIESFSIQDHVHQVQELYLKAS